MIDVNLPEKVLPAVENLSSRQYDRIVMYGGRGGAKSDSVAAIAIMESYIDDGVILCGREIQKTVADSLHSALCAEIEAKGLTDHFNILNTEITNKVTGARFMFAGFKTNITNIKSIKKLRVVIAEEAENVSQNSWDVIAPTPRYGDVRFYVVFNPRFEDDPTWQEFIIKSDDRTLLLPIGYQDNPWFPESLERQRQRDLRGDAGRYAWIWEGKFLKISDASILAKKLKVREFTADYSFGDPYIGIDWGFSNDPTAIVECYTRGKTLYIRNAAAKVGLELDDTADWLLSHVPLAKKFTSRADSSLPATISKVRRDGVALIKPAHKGKGSVEDGVLHLQTFDEIVIHPDAECAYVELAAYSYKTDQHGEPTTIIQDADNHYADCVRYALEPLIRGRHAQQSPAVGGGRTF